MGFILHACATPDGGSKKEAKNLKMSKSEMVEALSKLEIENEKLQQQIDIEKEMNQGLRIEFEKKLTYVSERNQSLNKEIYKLKTDIQNLINKNDALIKKLEDLPAESKISTPVSKKSEKDIGRLKIKVLWGDGNPDSAASLVSRLKKFGYNIQMTDQTPRPNFLITTIFFAPDFEFEAKRMISDLGGNLLLKPLSWPSTFDLILVTGSKK